MSDLEDKTKTQVQGILIYPRFSELFADFDLELFGGKGYSIDDMVESMYKYYSKIEEEKYGVVGIKIKLLDSK